MNDHVLAILNNEDRITCLNTYLISVGIKLENQIETLKIFVNELLDKIVEVLNGTDDIFIECSSFPDIKRKIVHVIAFEYGIYSRTRYSKRRILDLKGNQMIERCHYDKIGVIITKKYYPLSKRKLKQRFNIPRIKNLYKNQLNEIKEKNSTKDLSILIPKFKEEFIKRL